MILALMLALVLGPATVRSAEAPTPADVAACVKRGGVLQPEGLSGYIDGGLCTRSFRDAGKVCSDGSQCLSHRCQSDDRRAATGEAVGRCRATDYPFGCQALVSKGRAAPAVCVD